MTEDDLRARIYELTVKRDQALANANALGGAIQDCEFWLARLTVKDEPPPLKVVHGEGAEEE